MEPTGYGLVVQKERDRVTNRVNREAWMLESVDRRSRAKVAEALMRRILHSGN